MSDFNRFDALAAKPHTVIIDGRRYPNSTTAGDALNLNSRPLLTDPTPPAYRKQELPPAGFPPFMERALKAPGAPNANKSPLDLEFATHRIDANLAISAEWFYTQWAKANRSWKADSAEKLAPGELTGPEIAADAELTLRYVAFRLGDLYRVVVDAVVNEVSMAELCHKSDKDTNIVAKTRYGRRRLVDALTLLGVAHEAWIDLAYGRASPKSWALSTISKCVAPVALQAANDNAKAVGRHVMRAA